MLLHELTSLRLNPAKCKFPKDEVTVGVTLVPIVVMEVDWLLLLRPIN